MRRFFIALFFAGHAIAYGQSDDMGNWLMYFGQNKINEKFSLHTEIQFRNHSILLDEIEQLLIRGGLNYHVKQNVMLTAGYAYIPSYRLEDDINTATTEEDRIWQQLILKHGTKKTFFEHRFRAEQRWVEGVYRDRYRYRLMLTFPLNWGSQTKDGNSVNKYFLSFYDEIFLNTDGDAFDRNRLYGALGIKLKKQNSMQLGILNQALKNTSKWYFQIGFFLNTNFSKAKASN